MASVAQTSATTTLYVSASTPATYDTATFAALTWIKVAEISSIGAYGGKTSVVKHIPIDVGTVVKRSGSQDFGTINLTMARHSGSDFSALTAAFTDRQPRSFKVVLPSAIGQTDYFTGIVISNVTNIGNADKILESQVDIELDNAVLTA